jgi:hypothetical protein
MFINYSGKMSEELEDILTHDDDSSNKKAGKESSSSPEDVPKTASPTLLHAMYCLQPAVRAGIEVFDLNSDKKLSETIFRSICKCKSN